MDVHHVTAKQKGHVQIEIFNDNGYYSIASFHNALLAPNIWDRLFSIITLLNLGHTCSFQKGICTVYFGDMMKNVIISVHIVYGKHAMFGEIKIMSISKKLSPKMLSCVRTRHKEDNILIWCCFWWNFF